MGEQQELTLENQNIPGLDVPVNDALPVHKLHRQQQLSDNVPRLLLVQWPVGLPIFVREKRDYMMAPTNLTYPPNII